MTTRNTGLSKRIRGALARGPATTRELAESLNVETHKITSLLNQLMGRTGGVYRISDTYPHRYALTVYGASQSRTKAVSERVAGPVVIGAGSRWGSTRLG